MELRDVPAVTCLLQEYWVQFVVAPYCYEYCISEHFLLPTENVVDNYLVESPESHEIYSWWNRILLAGIPLPRKNTSSANLTLLSFSNGFFLWLCYVQVYYLQVRRGDELLNLHFFSVLQSWVKRVAYW